MIIDIHGHVTHPELLAKYPMPPSLGDIDGMLERKSEAGIGVTIVGSPVGFGTMMPVPGLDNYRQPLDRLSSFHDWLFGLTERYAGQLLCYAYTNPFGDHALLERTAEWAEHPGVVGIIANSSVNGTYLADDATAAFWEMAAGTGLPVFIHPPATPVGASALGDPRLLEQIGRYHDVAAALATLLFSDILVVHPDLQVIAATGGGGIGALVERLETARTVRHWGPPPGVSWPSGGSGPPAGAGTQGERRQAGPAAATAPTNSFGDLLRRVFVDAAVSNRQVLAANVGALGAANVLFGTDSPPIGVSFADAIAAITELPLPAESIEGILSGNARRLFRLDENGRPLRLDSSYETASLDTTERTTTDTTTDETTTEKTTTGTTTRQLEGASR